MRRLLLIVAMLGLVGVLGAVAARGQGDGADGPRRYTVELDNAFGLVEGADVKVAGVRAGKVTSFDIDPETYRALVGIEIGQRGFGDLRTDVFCETRPQSLIGEYFIDCLPGTARTRLEPGARIPVERTGSTIPADLVNNIMRRPVRERFSILLGELGAGLAARGEDLNETIRRANPALRETNKVLAELAEQRRVIRDLTSSAERVVTRLAANRGDVRRFISEARDTAAASAERAADLRGQFQRFPTFLRELRPTMRLLGEAADHQRPALANLSRSAPLLETFFNELGPFSEASRPAIRTLARAAEHGRGAVEAGTPRVRELAAFAEPLPELARNLAITLEHLHDRRFAVEEDPRSPGGKGFTGIEAILQYVFNQSQATNVFDANSYLLKVSAFLDNACAQYAVAETARREDRQYCRARLGPTQPGIEGPDPSAEGDGSARRRRATDDAGDDRRPERSRTPDASAAPDREPERGDEDRPPPVDPLRPLLPDVLPDEVEELLDGVVPGTLDALGRGGTGALGRGGEGVLGGRGGTLRDDRDTAALLDFLLGS